MYSYRSKVGRLVEVSFEGTVEQADIEGVDADARQLMLGTLSRYVCLVDMRKTRVLAPDVADALGAALKPFNPRIERTAVLIPVEQPTLAMQIERLHREAGHANRRTFAEPSLAARWLGAALGDRERARLSELLR